MRLAWFGGVSGGFRDESWRGTSRKVSISVSMAEVSVEVYSDSNNVYDGHQRAGRWSELQWLGIDVSGSIDERRYR